MDKVIQSLKKADEDYEYKRHVFPAFYKYLPFHEYIFFENVSKYYVTKMCRRKHVSLLIAMNHRLFCLRMKQEYWRIYHYSLSDSFMNDPYVRALFMEEKREKTRTTNAFLTGSRFGCKEALSKLTEHGPHHASLLRKKILKMAALLTQKTLLKNA